MSDCHCIISYSYTTSPITTLYGATIYPGGDEISKEIRLLATEFPRIFVAATESPSDKISCDTGTGFRAGGLNGPDPVAGTVDTVFYTYTAITAQSA